MRLTGYQTGRRWQGVRINVALIASYLNESAKSFVDIGCNEGTITNGVSKSTGAAGFGIEGNGKWLVQANRLRNKIAANVEFENKLFSIEDANALKVDAAMVLSVHHQVAAASSLEQANEWLNAIAKNVDQVFFQPACIASKYGCDVPFADNDLEHICRYFREVVSEDVMPHYAVIGVTQNDIPLSEPLRPMLVFSKSAIEMQKERPVAEVLDELSNNVSTWFGGRILRKLFRKI